MKAVCIALLILMLASPTLPGLWSRDARADAPLSAQPLNQAGLVVQFGDGGYIGRCVSFAEETITGLELLQRSGLDVSNQGAAICRIEREGCNYPEEPCFCQCDLSTPSCHYWTYWHWSNDTWRASGSGAGQYRLGPDDIDGWNWLGGPPSVHIALAELCDPLRTALRRPIVNATCNAIEVRLAYQGDANDDGSVRMRLREVGAPWPAESTPLQREAAAYHLRVSDLPTGDYELDLHTNDPDGVNGTDIWVLSTTVGTVADWLVDRPTPWIGERLTFTDASRGVQPTSQSWDWGDGSPVQSGREVTHTYKAAGPYTVTLTVESECGESVLQRGIEVRSRRLIFPKLYGNAVVPYPWKESTS